MKGLGVLLGWRRTSGMSIRGFAPGRPTHKLARRHRQVGSDSVRDCKYYNNILQISSGLFKGFQRCRFHSHPACSSFLNALHACAGHLQQNSVFGRSRPNFAWPRPIFAESCQGRAKFGRTRLDKIQSAQRSPNSAQVPTDCSGPTAQNCRRVSGFSLWYFQAAATKHLHLFNSGNAPGPEATDMPESRKTRHRPFFRRLVWPRLGRVKMLLRGTPLLIFEWSQGLLHLDVSQLSPDSVPQMGAYGRLESNENPRNVLKRARRS